MSVMAIVAVVAGVAAVPLGLASVLARYLLGGRVDADELADNPGLTPRHLWGHVLSRLRHQPRRLT